MKSIMLSIKPQYCELIVIGAKTVEVRKTRPKLDVPFKCYIYETKDNKRKYYDTFHENTIGKVIGEFVCDKIGTISRIQHIGYKIVKIEYIEEDFCLSLKEIGNYIGDKKGYTWHISELKIYDKPRPINAYRRLCDYGKKGKVPHSCLLCGRLGGHWNKDYCCNYLIRPPQSWYYVEELK